jgi:hypothetical protein
MAQVWAPSGATWYYEWASMWYSGYVKISYIGDTIVDSKSCKILKKERFTYDWVNHIYSNMFIGYEYTYQESNIVYYYRYGQFFKLYDFNSSAGSSWEVAGWEPFNPCDSTGLIVVNSTGMITVNSLSLKYLNVSPGQNSTWALSDTIIERIGPLGYMFPEPTCVVDLFEGGSLRCYSDDTFELYKRGQAPACDYIIGADEISPESNYFKIYPVPATSTITLEITKKIKDKMMIEISDILGKKMKSIEMDKVKMSIDIEDLKGGVYFILITDHNSFIWNRKIIKTAP